MAPFVSRATRKTLIRRSIDLRRLYQHAARECEPGLRLVLDENAHTLDLLVTDLQALSGERTRKPRRRESWRGALRRHVAGWLLRAVTRPDAAWIHLLMSSETALLRAFEHAIAAASSDTTLALRRQLPRLRSIHMDMHNLAGSPRC